MPVLETPQGKDVLSKYRAWLQENASVLDFLMPVAAVGKGGEQLAEKALRALVRYFTKETGAPFYSKLAEALPKLPNKASSEQVLATLKGQGVKDEEIQWVLGDLLKQPQVTKQELENAVKTKGVQLGEVIKGSGNSGGGEIADQILQDIGMRGGPSDTKFSAYAIPGGENYRETLLTLKGFGPEHMTMPTKSFKGGHFDEPNVLAHLRSNERVTPEGKKALFLEEVQSDWHQKGRSQGYSGQEKVLRAEPSGHNTGKGEGWWNIYDESGTRVGTIAARNATTADDAIRLIRSEQRPKVTGVPDAPFKKTWHELALKRALDKAVKGGYDELAWTTGKTQADRYNLAKHLDAIEYIPTDGTLTGWQNGRRLINETVSPDKLPDYVGKDVADRLVNKPTSTYKVESPGNPTVHVVRGGDLSVGGEGMSGFYDKMLVDFANKYGKKWGARVETKEIAPGVMAHRLPVTPAMKKEVEEKGQALFAAAPLAMARDEDTRSPEDYAVYRQLHKQIMGKNRGDNAVRE